MIYFTNYHLQFWYLEISIMVQTLKGAIHHQTLVEIFITTIFLHSSKGSFSNLDLSLTSPSICLNYNWQVLKVFHAATIFPLSLLPHHLLKIPLCGYSTNQTRHDSMLFVANISLNFKLMTTRWKLFQHHLS